ncbi:MAG: ATP-binding protein [bacterium]
MNLKRYKKYPVVVYFYLLKLVWTLIIIGFLFWFYQTEYTETIVLIKQQSHTVYKQNLVFRAWASKHGGVYVPVTDETPPNPHLSNILERDIIAPSGKKLTLMNPAYITRQIFEMALKTEGLREHITSLKPIRKENKPDIWEITALNAFEKGKKEYSSFNTINKKKFFRYMGPLITKNSCLKCHASQGYKTGDIRGGISIALLWEPYSSYIYKQTQKMAIIFGIIWLFGFLSLRFVRKKIVIQHVKRDEYANELNKTNEELFLSRNLLEENLFERNKLINEINEMNGELTKLNLEKDKFFSIIAHDLRSPFNGLIGLTEIIAQEAEIFSKEELSDLSNQIHNSAVRLSKLLQNLLDWTQIQSGKMTLTIVKQNLRKVVMQNLILFENLIKQKKINIEINIDSSIIIYADENMFNSIIRNLISNAIKYTPINGLIILFARNINNNELEFSVTDSGIGIPQDILHNLFKIEEKVSRTGTNKEQGTGLGLILCKEFVEKHGGKIWVKSKENEGSVFYFTIQQMEDR